MLAATDQPPAQFLGRRPSSANGSNQSFQQLTPAFHHLHPSRRGRGPPGSAVPALLKSITSMTSEHISSRAHAAESTPLLAIQGISSANPGPGAANIRNRFYQLQPQAEATSRSTRPRSERAEDAALTSEANACSVRPDVQKGVRPCLLEFSHRPAGRTN